MSAKKLAVKNAKLEGLEAAPEPAPEETQPQEIPPTETLPPEAPAEQPESLTLEPEPSVALEPEPSPSPEPPSQSLTLESLHQEIQSLKAAVAELQETLARKRKPPASNGKVQIRDKQTGEIYPSKNNAYQTLLKSGELKPLVDKGVFGDIPQKNTFGWYVLAREWPERFEELPEAK